jgi:hypothetical protein
MLIENKLYFVHFDFRENFFCNDTKFVSSLFTGYLSATLYNLSRIQVAHYNAFSFHNIITKTSQENCLLQKSKIFYNLEG